MSGLKVQSDSDEDIRRWVDLPATYTKEQLPADVGRVATREKTEIWDHLKKIANKVLKVSDITIGLLTGANCAKALEPQEVIPSKDGGPFVYKSPLGLCVVGPLVKGVKKGSISCNRIEFKMLPLERWLHITLESQMRSKMLVPNKCSKECTIKSLMSQS